MENKILKDSKIVIDELNDFEKKQTFDWEILNKIGTFHLRNSQYLKEKVNKQYLTLKDINYITTYQKGLINFELSGNIYCSLLNNSNFIFSVNKESSGWNFEAKKPFSHVSFDYEEKGSFLKGSWHLHPWNSMNIKDNDGVTISNFFSIEDIDTVFTYPKHLFVIFNMQSPNTLKYPCIYFLMFNPELISFNAGPTKWQKTITGYQRVLVPFIYEKMKSNDDRINWEDIKTTFLSLGITFEYLYDYNNENFAKKMDIITQNMKLPNCR